MTGRKSDVSSAIPATQMAVTLRLRSAPAAVTERRQRRIADRLAELVADADDATLRTEYWSDSVRVPRTGSERAAVPAVELYEELRDAVDDAGGRLHPFFQERTPVEDLFTESAAGGGADADGDAAADGEGGAERDADADAGDAGRNIVFPVVCVTFRRSGRLTGVYPCWLDGDHHSVELALDRLDDGDVDAAENLW